MRLREILPVLVFTLAPTLCIAADQRLSDLLLQIERLQQEVQQLRGQVELQQHELSTLKRQQRDQYMDLDARLQGRDPDRGTGQSSGSGVHSSANGAQSGPSGASSAHSAQSAIPSGKPSGETQSYRVAFDLLKQHRYDDAIQALDDLLARYPNGELADNARYWLGEANYVKRNYSSALTQFQRVLANYPLSPKVPASMLKIGYIHYDQSDWPRARSALKDVVDKFPDTAEARLAESRLERLAHEGH